MANWLERAKQQIPQSTDRATAKADERNPTAVMAVPKPGESENSVPVTTAEEAAIRAWLAHIEETDEAIIATVLDQCRVDVEALRYFLRRAEEVLGSVDDDDRRRCDQCANLTPRGRCLAAWRGEVVASRDYEPVRGILRRCEGYAPGPDDSDKRYGRERWPGLITEKGENHANN